jgi:hypothetical protein
MSTVTDEVTGKKRVVHTPKPKPTAVMTQTNTVNVPDEPEQTESRQVRRANARRTEKRIKQHMNEVVLKKNKKRR